MTRPAASHWLPRLLLIWAAAAALTFAGMLTHQSDLPVLFGRYSTLVAGMLAGLLVIVLVAAGVGLWLRGRPDLLANLDAGLGRLRARRAFPVIVLAIAGVALAGVWLFFLGDHLPTYGLLRLFLGATITVGGLALLFGGEPSPAPARWSRLALTAVLGLFVVAVLAVEFYPAMYRTDEAVIFSMARGVLDNGHTRPTIYRQTYPLLYAQGGIWTWMLAGWLKVAGISFASGRLYFLLMGCGALALVWATARRFYGHSAAWFAALAGVFAVMSLNYIRFDMPCALFLAGAIFFHSLGRDNGRWWAHFLAGLCAALCIDSTPIGYCFGFGFGLFYLGKYVQFLLHLRRGGRAVRFFWAPFWALAAGGALGLGIYLLTRSGAAFVGAASAGTGSALSGYVGTIGEFLVSGHFLTMIGQVLHAFLTGQPLLFGLVVLGVITALRERTTADVLLLTLLGAWMGVIILTYYYFPVLYLVHGLPILLLLAGRGLASGLPRLIGSRPGEMNVLTRAAVILLAAWLAVSFVQRLSTQSSLEELVEVGRQTGALLPDDALIVAAEPYYFGLLDHPAFTGGVIEATYTAWHGYTPEAAWEEIAPDAIIFSEFWPEPPRTPALEAYLVEHSFTLLACWQTQAYGTVQLYADETIAAGFDLEDMCRPVCVPRLGCATP